MNEKLKRLEQLFKAIDRSAVYIGVVGGSHTDNETHQTIRMPELAAVHEFGSAKRNIPERSFLRSSIEDNKQNYTNQMANLIKQAAQGSVAPSAVYGAMGAVAAGQAQKKISNGQLAPLKPQTIQRKGSSKPLYDTGQLVQSITWVVRDE